jgi:beta-aspartyl-peptidase (threonine type)
MTKPYGLVLHGGAGVILRKDMSPELEAQYRAKLAEAREAGYAVLESGGSALDAVTATVVILEDSPLFNAGKGAVLNAEGNCELDASIMEGATQAAGAVAGVQHIRNPVRLARDVMEKSPHVMLIGEGAEQFARQLGHELVPNDYFKTEMRRKQLERAQAEERAGRKVGAMPEERLNYDDDGGLLRVNTNKFGTVGCVALDRHGNLAAATSTGGMTNKKFGRVGDAPIIGAGTYANNATCAVSATGWGEFFIRVGVARDIAAQMEYKGAPLAAAADSALAKVAALGGDGGLIAIDRHGHVAMPFNTPGMYRGCRLSDGTQKTEIFSEEK